MMLSLFSCVRMERHICLKVGYTYYHAFHLKKKGRFTIMFKNGYNTLLISLFIHAYILSICFRSSTKKLQHIHICYKITEEKNCQGKIISTICNSFSLIVIWFQFKTIFFKSESSETSTSLRKNKAYAMEMIW